MWAEVMFVYFALTQGETEKDRGQLNEMYEAKLDDRRQRGGDLTQINQLKTMSINRPRLEVRVLGSHSGLKSFLSP